MSNFRNIPHPRYGNWGGKNNLGGKNPIDPMDALFKKHDLDLKAANLRALRHKADTDLFKGLLSLKLSELAKPLWGRLYWIGSVIAFGTVHLINKRDK